MKEVNVSLNKWNVLTYFGLMLIAILLSPVGAVIGTVNLKNPARKKQAYWLLAIGVIFTVLWLYHFFGSHHH